MGVMTDFFLASTTDVNRVLTGWQLPPLQSRDATEPRTLGLPSSAQVPLIAGSGWHQPPKPNPNANPAPQIDSLPNVQCRDMLPDKLALLFASLTEIPADHAMDLILRGYLTGPPETEVTVQRLPVALTNALATADDADLERAAKTLEEDDIDRWGNSFRGSARELIGMLQRVQTLAKRGLSSNADLFIWTCT
jgi:hypothetical protein